MRLRKMRIGAMLVMVALAGACGGDDDSGGGDAAREAETEEASEDAAPAKAEYISQADAICADYLAQSEELTTEAEEVASDEPDPVAVKEFMDKQLDLAGQLLADVRALTLPAGQAGAEIEGALDSFGQATEAARAETDTPEKALAFMTAGVQQAFGAEGAPSPALEASDAADAQAATVGFQTCFSGGDE
jgi:hypothetical protein